MKKYWILLCLLPALASAQKISQLPAGVQPTGTELVPIVQSSTTVSVTTGQIAAYVITQLSQADVLGLFTEPAHYALMGPALSGPSSVSFRALVSADIPNNSANTSGNAGTATALATAPTGCSGVNFSQGIAANGNATCAQPSSVTGNAATATALAATPSQCSGEFVTGIAASGNANCSETLSSLVVGSPTGGNEGAGSINAQSIFVNGVSTLPKLTYGNLALFSSPSCSVSSVPPASNITSCSNAATGQWTVNISTAYGTGATCVASLNGSTAYLVAATDLSTGTSFTVDTFNTSGTAVNANMDVSIICMGT